MQWDGSTRFPLRLEAMRLNTHWMRQHCWMWQRLYTQCATMLCQKYVGFITFRTAYTIESYSARHSTKPTTTTRHGHVVNYVVSLCAHAHQNTQIPCAPLVPTSDAKSKHVSNMFRPCTPPARKNGSTVGARNMHASQIFASSCCATLTSTQHAVKRWPTMDHHFTHARCVH